MARKSYATDQQIVQAVIERAGGLCELGGPPHQGHHPHHRRMRSQLGKDTMENIRWVCWREHRMIHDNPARSYEMGWLVRSWQEPGDVPWLPL